MSEDMNKIVKQRAEEYKAMEQTDSENSPVHTSIEFPTSDHDPPTIDPTSSNEKEWGCPWCEVEYDNLKSLTGHVLGKSRHDDIHNYQEFRERYADKLQAEKKKPKKDRAPTGSAAVKIQPFTTEFDPAEAQEIADLKRQTAILQERLAQKGIADKLGVPEREEQQQRAFYDEQQQREDALQSKDRQIERLYKQIDKDRQRAHEKEIAQIKTGHSTDLKFLELEHKFDIKLAERDQKFGNWDEEVNKSVVKGIDTLVDSFRISSKHNMGELRKLTHAAQRLEHGDNPDEMPDIEPRSGTNMYEYMKSQGNFEEHIHEDGSKSLVPIKGGRRLESEVVY